MESIILDSKGTHIEINKSLLLRTLIQNYNKANEQTDNRLIYYTINRDPEH